MTDDAEELRVHECEQLPRSGVGIYYGQGLRGVRSEAWHLHLRREATSEDLEENSNLEEEGESMWSVCAEISFCPYCGHDLSTGSTATSDVETVRDDDPGYGAFVMFDQENWSGRLR